MDKEIILCDSNIIIDWINHKQKAIDDLQYIKGSIAISIITELDLPLFTYNKKDFRYIPSIRLYDDI